MRYKLSGKFRWCLNFKNGWIAIGKYILRWNSTPIFNKKEADIVVGLFKVKNVHVAE